MSTQQAFAARAYRPEPEARVALASRVLNNTQVPASWPPTTQDPFPTTSPTTGGPLGVQRRAYRSVSNANESASVMRQAIRKIQSMRRTKMHAAYRRLCTELVQHVTVPSDPMPVARLLESFRTADDEANQDWDLLTGLGPLIQDYLTRSTIEMLQFPSIETWFGQLIARMCGVDAGTVPNATEWHAELRDQVAHLDLDVAELTESVLRDLKLLSISPISPLHVLESIDTSVGALKRTFEHATPGVLTEFITRLQAVQETIPA